MKRSQGSLFATDEMPRGLRYEAGFLAEAEEADLIRRIGALPFRPFASRNRQTVAFGWAYWYGVTELAKIFPIPYWLLDVRGRAAAFAGLAPDTLEHLLLTKYEKGAGFGWHRDLPGFGEVIGISLRSPAPLRFRCRAGARWERFTLAAAPRSIYALRGSAREEWEHSLAPVAQLRYSITFRTLR